MNLKNVGFEEGKKPMTRRKSPLSHRDRRLTTRVLDNKNIKICMGFYRECDKISKLSIKSNKSVHTSLNGVYSVVQTRKTKLAKMLFRSQKATKKQQMDII